jgi:hypothetical protein
VVTKALIEGVCAQGALWGEGRTATPHAGAPARGRRAGPWLHRVGDPTSGEGRSHKGVKGGGRAPHVGVCAMYVITSDEIDCGVGVTGVGVVRMGAAELEDEFP